MNKSALKRLALELRAEVGQDGFERFDPYLLAQLYGIDVYQLSGVGCSSAALAHFEVFQPSSFSGALVPVGSGFVIIENDFHEEPRRRATAAHEMAHVALEHSFSASVVDERGCRTMNSQDESEATELGAELLLPSEAAKRLACRRFSDAAVAEIYNVSLEVSRWRMNATGARTFARRLEAKRQRSR